jgi:hypothetical protein
MVCALEARLRRLCRELDSTRCGWVCIIGHVAKSQAPVAERHSRLLMQGMERRACPTTPFAKPQSTSRIGARRTRQLDKRERLARSRRNIDCGRKLSANWTSPPALCNRLCILSVGLPGVATRQAPSDRKLSPVPLAGLLFGRPCPLRWLPAGARRMPRRDSAEPAETPARSSPDSRAGAPFALAIARAPERRRMVSVVIAPPYPNDRTKAEARDRSIPITKNAITSTMPHRMAVTTARSPRVIGSSATPHRATA